VFGTFLSISSSTLEYSVSRISKLLLGLVAALSITACGSEPSNPVGYTPDHAYDRYGSITDPLPAASPTEAPAAPEPAPTLTASTAKALPAPYKNKQAQPQNPCALVTSTDISTTFGRTLASSNTDGYTLNMGYSYAGNGSETARIGSLTGNRRLCYYRETDGLEPVYMTVITEAYRYKATARQQFNAFEDGFDDSANAEQRSIFNEADEALYGVINQKYTIEGKKLQLRLSSVVIRNGNKLTMIMVYAPDLGGIATRDALESLAEQASQRM
jgi:hypothetical protein